MPTIEAATLGEMFQNIFEHEQVVTKAINGLAHSAFTTQDYSTFSFLQWYVAEQHEEINTKKLMFNYLNFNSASHAELS